MDGCGKKKVDRKKNDIFKKAGKNTDRKKLKTEEKNKVR